MISHELLDTIETLHKGSSMIDDARALRLAVVMNVYNQGLVSEEEAKELLSGPLTPGDNSTIVDDSAMFTKATSEETTNNDQ